MFTCTLAWPVGRCAQLESGARMQFVQFVEALHDCASSKKESVETVLYKVRTPRRRVLTGEQLALRPSCRRGER